MRRSIRGVRLAVAVLATLSACGRAPAEGPAAPGPRDAVWPEGEYELEADVPYRTEGPTGAATRRVTQRAVLSVGPDGPTQLMSTAGLCRMDPRDQRLRNRRFLCGDATYEVEPTGGAVGGRVSVRAQVMVEGTPRCARYEVDENGNRTCVRWDTPVETRWTTLSERLRVKRLDGGAPSPPRETRRSG